VGGSVDRGGSFVFSLLSTSPCRSSKTYGVDQRPLFTRLHPMLVVSDSLRAGRLGVERVGLIDDGGVMELWEEVSILIPATTDN
jgi:hypothetical protein